MKDFKNLSELERLLYRELYKKSFYEFVKEFWNEADPQKYIDGLLVQFYCEFFQYLCRDFLEYNLNEPKIKLPKLNDNMTIIDVRQKKRNGNINIPPRHSKSMVLNVLAGCWLWINCPAKMASISHTRGLAGQMNKKRQTVINSEKFKFFFPEIKLVTNTSDSLIDNRGGELYSQSRDALTGYGFDIGVCDDLTNAEAARRDREEMNSAWSFFQNTLPSRVNNTNKYVILNIQQRLAPNDITGHIMSDKKLSDEYIFVVLPAQFKIDTYLVFPISGKVHLFKKGDYLWPERFGNYESLRNQVGELVWQTQYLQESVNSDQTIIKENMIIEKDLPDTPGIENADMIYASHDFPVKDKETNDFLGSALGYRHNATLYVVDSLEKHLGFVKSVEYVKHLDNVYPGIIQIIEDKANGSPILQQLQDEVAGMQAFNPGTDSKSQRLASASLYMQSKNVVLVRTEFNKLTQRWELSESMQNLKNRLLAFPHVEHDDIIDGFDMMILFVFMDRRYMVYGRAFNENNLIDFKDENLYNVIFFNKEGDIWKALQIGVKYGEETKMVVEKEIKFKASVDDGINKLKRFAPDNTLFIDCSENTGLTGMYENNVTIERYSLEDFDKSVAQTNLAFSKNLILIDRNCVLTKSDIENFKFTKSKNDTVKYTTTKDGFVSCIRTALQYFGGII